MRDINPYLLAKLQSKTQTKWNKAQPKMSIQVSRAKTTVSDSTYWTTEVIRDKTGLGDLSVSARRTKKFGSPDRLFNIYVDNGVVKTATRGYPDYEEKKWQEAFSLGNGSAVAIAFSGYWELYRKRWQMVTEDSPWVFWVSSGVLYGQFWDDVSTRIELVASGVTKVKAIRGWINKNLAGIDQGLIVGYIKTDGKVYYRNLAVQDTGEILWETEKQLTQFTGNAANLNLFITNDYRMGFAIEDTSAKTQLYITHRAWAGLAIQPDKFVVKAKTKVDLLPVKYNRTYNEERFVTSANANLAFLYADGKNEFLTVENVDDGFENFGIVVNFSVKHRITNFDPTNFEMYDENNVVFRGLSGSKADDYNFNISFQDFNNAVGDLRAVSLGGVLINEAGYIFNAFETVFTPIGLVPIQIEAPEVELIWNE